MTSTSELNLSALWDLPSEQQHVAAVLHFATGSYVSTAANQSPRSEDGTYVTVTSRTVRADQSRGQDPSPPLRRQGPTSRANARPSPNASRSARFPLHNSGILQRAGWISLANTGFPVIPQKPA
jgi:hypothetical protein